MDLPPRSCSFLHCSKPAIKLWQQIAIPTRLLFSGWAQWQEILWNNNRSAMPPSQGFQCHATASMRSHSHGTVGPIHAHRIAYTHTHTSCMH